MKKKNRLAVSLLALSLCLSLAACSGGGPAASSPPDPKPAESAPAAPAAESDVAYIQEKGTLVVAITPFAPMDYQNESGEWIGFDADMARKIAEALGVEIQFSVIEWSNKLMELDSKTVDCLWNGMTITNEITSGASATNAYAKNGQVVVLKSDAAGQYQTEDSVKDLSFAVETGSAGEEVAQDMGLTFNSVDSQATALMEVSAGTSDACIIDLLMAGAMIGEGTSYPDLTYTVQLTTEDYGVGCRKGSDLTAFINEQMKALYEDGTMLELAETYGVQEAIIPQA